MCTHVDGRICKVSSTFIQYRDQRKKKPNVQKTAQGKCEIIRFFFFERERNKVDN